MKRFLLPVVIITACLTFLSSELGFYGTIDAAPPAVPFVDAADQRNEMIRELKEIKELLKQQNQLLKDVVKDSRATEKPKP